VKHIVKLFAKKEVNDEMVTLGFRCCDDDSTDSYCTVSLRLGDEELKEALAGHQAKMASVHEKKLALRSGQHVLSSTSETTINL
jgi:hypothetical protein